MKKIKPTIHFVEKSNEFVGIKSNKEKIDVFLPQVFRVKNDKTYKKDILKFLSSISIAKSSMKENLYSGKTENHIEVWPIDSFLWIIHDYLKNGYYYNRVKKESFDNKGRIIWKKTLRTVPIYSDGNIIYDKIISYRISDSNDIITQIYKICLKSSMNKIGWAFNYNFNVDVVQTKSIKEMIYIINKEVSSTFDDIKKLRFKHMFKILNGMVNDNALTSHFTYGITNYYYVFETMVDYLFKGIKGPSKRDYDPFAEWQLLNMKGTKRSSRMRPDTIHIKGDKVVIIDAKMYQYGVTHELDDLPGISSIQKQITYGDFLHNYVYKNQNKNIQNVFIIPYNKEIRYFKENKYFDKCLDDNLVYIGVAKPVWRGDFEQPYDTVHAFMIDFNFLLNNYRKDLNEYINSIIGYIFKQIK